MFQTRLLVLRLKSADLHSTTSSAIILTSLFGKSTVEPLLSRSTHTGKGLFLQTQVYFKLFRKWRSFDELKGKKEIII